MRLHRRRRACWTLLEQSGAATLRASTPHAARSSRAPCASRPTSSPSDETESGPARDPELRPHRRARAGGGVRLRPAARRGGGAGDGRGAAISAPRWASARPRSPTARARCSRASACPSTSSAGFDAQVLARLDRRQEAARRRPSGSCSCPAPGRDAPRGDRARRHRLTPRRTRAGRESLTPRIPTEYKRQSHVRSVPRKHQEAGRQARRRRRRRPHGLRRHQPSTRYAKSGYDGALPDIQTLAMEFAHLIAQARRTLQSLDAGRAGGVHAAHRHR